MQAIVEAKKILESLKTAELDAVYTVNLPREIQENVDETIALITEVDIQLSGFGNDDFFEIENTIQLQVFHKLRPKYNLSDFEKSILKGFFSAHWNIVDIKPKIYDPDTEQLTWSVYMTKRKEL